MVAQCEGTAIAGSRSAIERRVADPVSDEFEALWRLGPDAVRRRWRGLVGKPMPRGLGRVLTLRILIYYAQVQQHGSLDRASHRLLTEVLDREPQKGAASSPLEQSSGRARQSKTIVRSPDLLRPGTLLSREYEGILHKVMVLDRGFGWNGQTFESLSKVALAITGTRWNGPRFFGLRDKPTATRKTTAKRNEALVVTGRGRATLIKQPRAHGATL